MASARLHELRACRMSLYPTKDSLVEALEYIEAQCPLQPHQIFPLLMMYQNTLLQELERHAQDQRPHGKPDLTVVT